MNLYDDIHIPSEDDVLSDLNNIYEIRRLRCIGPRQCYHTCRVFDPEDPNCKDCLRESAE